MAKGTHRRQSIAALLDSAIAGDAVTLTGWVKTSRFSKNVSFVHLFDGSTTRTAQVVLPQETPDTLKKRLVVGASVKVIGHWVQSPGGKQALEVSIENEGEVTVIGDCDASKYPLQKKRTSFEFLRGMAHLRPRTNSFQSVFRVRNQVSWQIHRFFQERGFLWIHTPFIGASDAEGAGELFEVTSGDKPEGFFGKPSFLTCSGQLQVESFAAAYTDVYTFGPTFRAENSNTTRHASEFWMIEPEIAFANMDDLLDLIEDFVKTITRETMSACAEDFAFFNLRIEKGLIEKLKSAIDSPFARVTYAEAQEILVKSGKSFEFPIGMGTHLQSDHERYLAEEHFNGPVFVTDYPNEQKAFYMRLNDDKETVAAVDLLMPRIGELLGGSMREERLDVLHDQMTMRGMDEAPYWWYSDLRRFGSTPHGGFGLGLERLLMWLTGMQNIRDVLPFPRTPGSADF